ncbi:MAG: hypothetical protein OEM60_14775, partial [Gammaproteobacteria bacterium]|nr:hypothetical protein [Gammaproteobacteria bacterium]
IGAVNIDLDIAQFRVTKRVRLGGNKPPEVSIMLTVKNNGDFNDQTRPATLTGVQNGVIVYTEAQEVSDPLGNGRSRYLFGPYVPTVAGDIAWTMVIADDDPDDDVATEVTLVR